MYTYFISLKYIYENFKSYFHRNTMRLPIINIHQLCFSTSTFACTFTFCI